MTTTERFTVTVDDAGRGRTLVRLPFDPNATWGDKPQHHVRGTIAGNFVRGPLLRNPDGWALQLGAAWLRDNPLPVDEMVDVELEAEGPQAADMAADVAAALGSSPRAAAFFAGLATYYRKGYLRWLDGAVRRPDVRAQRLRQLVVYLEEGRKERPR